eukprot:gene61184-81562_t
MWVCGREDQKAKVAQLWPGTGPGETLGTGRSATGLYHLGMDLPRDVAAIRLDNALLLFDEFVRATVKHPDAATLRGLERRFAERLQIQPSYWSQIKGRSRQIGEAHRGSIRAENRLGPAGADGVQPRLGARFTVSLPALPQAN